MPRRAPLAFFLTFAAGMAFFVLPLPVSGKLTVAFDLLISGIRQRLPGAASLYAFALICSGALATILAQRHSNPQAQPAFLRAFATSRAVALLRLAGMLVAAAFLLDLVPAALHRERIVELIWQTLAVSVALIIPLGAMFVQLLVCYGGMDFLGVLAQPVMQPLFKLPGRAALDALTSWAGSYSVGLYITRTVYNRKGYSKRHVFILATCFSTVSMGFVGVVASTLHLLHLFPLIVVVYLLAVLMLAAVLVRLPPLRNVPDGLEETPPPTGALWRRAYAAAIARAAQAPPLFETLRTGFSDGLVLAASILGTIVSVGTAALLLAKFTPVFVRLGQPVQPLLRALGLPDAATLAPAVVIGVTEMYLPALLATGASEPARFFIAVLSISQLIFFSSLGPMIIDMFRDIPIRARHLLALFALRTVLLLPLLAGLVYLLVRLGVLRPGG